MLPVGTVAAISQGGPSPSSAAIVAAPTGVRERRSGDAVSIPESSEQRTSTDVVEAVSPPTRALNPDNMEPNVTV